jgi:thiol-disulfide isomerase/thioredoxin
MRKLLALLLALGALAAQSHAGSKAEEQVAAAIKAPGVSVVHLWAPWCGNCKSELKSGGWTRMVKENPEVKFYFVSVWAGGDDGRAVLAQQDLAAQPNVTILADPGPRGAGRITSFLGLPFGWIPSTWVFKGGNLFYALNYGEIRFPMLQQMIADSKAEW